MKYLVGSLLCAVSGWHEVAAQQAATPLKKQFLDSAFAVLPSAAGARYWRENDYTADSTAGVRRTYYVSGQLYERTNFAQVRVNEWEFVSDCFDQAGQLVTHCENKRAYFLDLRYYPGGQLKRWERQRYGIFGRKKGKCFAPDGSRVPYFKYEIPPHYPEGDGSMRTVLKVIQRTLHYPENALRAHIEGRVFVAFTISAAGNVEHVRVARSLLPSLDAEAIRAVYQLRRFEPGQLDGKPRTVRCTIPIDFHLE